MKRIASIIGAAFVAGALTVGGVAAPAAAADPLVLPSPVQVDECGTDNDTIDVPEVDGVAYGVYDYTGASATGWLADPANNYGFVEGEDAILVIATQDDWRPFEQEIAPQGDFKLDSAGSPGWWFPTFTNVECEAEPLVLPAPVLNADCSVTTPEVEGVTYGVYNYTNATKTGWLADDANNYGFEVGDDILVIASYSDWSSFGDDPIAAEAPTGFDSEGNPGWWFENTCVQTVTPKAPTWVDPAPGVGDAYWVAPEQAGVTYTQKRFSNGKVQIIAKAAPGYAFPAGVVTQWQKIDK